MIGGRKVQTSLDPRANAVVVQEGASIKEAAQSNLRNRALAESVDVEIRHEDVARFATTPMACSVVAVACGKPLRGGVALCPWDSTMCSPCTAAFKATGKVFGNQFMLTAGHCGMGQFKADTHLNEKHYVGYTEQASFPGGDFAKINANGTWWADTPSWPTLVAFWGTDQEYPINAESWSYQGQVVYHAGYTYTDCAPVTLLNKTVEYAEGEVHGPTEFGPGCIDDGDSGGPVLPVTSRTKLFRAVIRNFLNVVAQGSIPR